MAHVFLCHRSADKPLVEQLATELQAAGHTIWFDLWNIGVGDSIIRKINEGLEGATYLVLCLSVHDITAPWMGQEWMSALARQLNGHSIKVLPVRLSGGEPPAILADVRYADLVADWKKGLAELLRAIH